MSDPAPQADAQLASFLLVAQTRQARYGIDPNDMAVNVATLCALIDAVVDHRIYLATGQPPP